MTLRGWNGSLVDRMPSRLPIPVLLFDQMLRQDVCETGK